MARLLFAVVVLWAAYLWIPGVVSFQRASAVPPDPGPRALPAAYRAPSDLTEPRQERPEGLAPFAHRGSLLTPRAFYHIEARVLGRERYRWDANADLAPWDLLLGWGPMRDEGILAHFHFRQNARFGFWSWKGPLPLSEQDVNRHIANVHLIPASDAVRAALGRVRTDQTVRVSGMLVDVRRPDGSRWNTSLRRTDRGDGACEILFATRIDSL